MEEGSTLRLKELERQIMELRERGLLDEGVVKRLSADPRRGAQLLAERLQKEVEFEVRERERLRAMGRYEEEAHSQGFQRVAGVDEAGRGPLAGPVVAAAVILPEGVFIPDLNDSKKLSASKREAIFEILHHSEGIAIGVGIVEPRTIDEVNILQATYMAMRKAVEALQHPPDFVLVDGNRLPLLPVPARPLPKGDSRSISVAAASIVAKVTRDRIMSELDVLYPQYGFARHKGYGTAEHIAAIRRHGLTPVHRRSFCRTFIQLSLDEA